MWKLEFWELEIKFGTWNFEESFKDGILKIKNNNNNNENNKD